MKPANECLQISDVREAIDQIDYKIVELIAQRHIYVKKAARFKQSESSVRDTQRVQHVISSKIELAKQLNAPPLLIEKLYKLMIDFFVKDELIEWDTIKTE